MTQRIGKFNLSIAIEFGFTVHVRVLEKYSNQTHVDMLFNLFNY